jgi:hypothetical protein
MNRSAWRPNVGLLPRRHSAVMSRGVRRVWVMVLVGLLGLAIGFTTGFAVGLLKRSVDANWFEAVGTWVGAGSSCPLG